MNLTLFPTSNGSIDNGDTEQPEWRPALDALMGSRHGGRVHELLNALRDLDRRYPNVAEINYQLAWTYEVLERETEASRKRIVRRAPRTWKHAARDRRSGAGRRRFAQRKRTVSRQQRARRLPRTRTPRDQRTWGSTANRDRSALRHQRRHRHHRLPTRAAPPRQQALATSAPPSRQPKQVPPQIHPLMEDTAYNQDTRLYTIGNQVAGVMDNDTHTAGAITTHPQVPSARTRPKLRA